MKKYLAYLCCIVCLIAPPLFCDDALAPDDLFDIMVSEANKAQGELKKELAEDLIQLWHNHKDFEQNKVLKKNMLNIMKKVGYVKNGQPYIPAPSTAVQPLPAGVTTLVKQGKRVQALADVLRPMTNVYSKEEFDEANKLAFSKQGI